MAEAPELGVRRLLLIGAGALNVAFLPFWVTWLRTAYPELETRIVLTRTARRFVSAEALAALSHGEVHTDEWPEGGGARHLEWERWADGMAVFPATLHLLGRLANGLGDSPALLALQCTTAPVVLAPALPPGGWESPAVRRHVALLKERPNVAIVPPRPGPSATTGRDDAWVPAPFPTALMFLERCRSGLQEP
ncbi:flavoprotein [Spirilliplanes yamanashiensis]|uniref:Phosphopantothenoylcysteine synthetase n=1 Tax=Spirilliplanes yamanashiensis TaxID=42233 RepID=A0A8J3Y472_9ACTN|nr:flavoprotein [Spirilliplanes yamanashiensis]MDP9820004.1 phosphopantothenoylcysteine synthetase/decarboxylase [Spirilliplanes yamanashiensis]GIJ01177.1 phosphopantothenoylcysteine synthetase [Spirilliplanes yamanashiensis]